MQDPGKVAADATGAVSQLVKDHGMDGAMMIVMVCVGVASAVFVLFLLWRWVTWVKAREVKRDEASEKKDERMTAAIEKLPALMEKQIECTTKINANLEMHGHMLGYTSDQMKRWRGPEWIEESLKENIAISSKVLGLVEAIRDDQIQRRRGQ